MVDSIYMKKIIELKKKEVKQLELRNKIEIQKIAIEQGRDIVDLTRKIEGIELE